MEIPTDNRAMIFGQSNGIGDDVFFKLCSSAMKITMYAEVNMSGCFYTKFMLTSVGMWSNINYHSLVIHFVYLY